jgi:hypothetical protein
MQVKELVQKKFVKVDEATRAEQIKKARKEYEKPCKGMFEFIDAQGGWLDFTDRVFPGDPVRVYHINHGEICELPMGLVKRLNNTKKRVRKLNAANLELGQIASYDYVSRVRFTPVDVL